jgi:hypothetical protein
VARLAVSPDGVLLLVVGEDGQTLLVNLPRRALLIALQSAVPYWLERERCAHALLCRSGRS